MNKLGKNIESGNTNVKYDLLLELSNKFSEYKEKRGNLQEAASMLRGDIVPLVQNNQSIIWSDGVIRLMLLYAELRGDEMYFQISAYWEVDREHYKFKSDAQESKIMQIWQLLNTVDNIPFNINEIQQYGYKKSELFKNLMSAFDWGYDFDIEKRTIEKSLTEVKTLDSKHVSYIEGLILKLENEEDLSKQISRVYIAEPRHYVILLGGRDDVKIHIYLKDKQLFIGGDVDCVSQISPYEGFLDQFVIKKYKEYTDAETAAKQQVKTKKSLLNTLTFGLFGKGKTENFELEEKRSYMDELSDFYKGNMQSIRAKNIEDMAVKQAAHKILEDIKEDFHDKLWKRDESFVPYLFVLKKYWERISGGSYDAILEYLIQYENPGFSIKKIFANVENDVNSKVQELCTREVELSDTLHADPEHTYSMYSEEGTIIYDPNNWLVKVGKMGDVECAVMSHMNMSFSGDGKKRVGYGEAMSAGCHIYEGNEKIRDFTYYSDERIKEVAVNKENIIQYVDKRLIVTQIEENGDNVDYENVENFAVSPNVNLIAILSEDKLKLVKPGVDFELDLWDIKVGYVNDIVYTKKGLNIIYADMDSSTINIRLYKTDVEGMLDKNDYQDYKFPEGYLPLHNTMRISSDNSRLLVVDDEEEEVRVFEFQETKLVDIAILENVLLDGDSIQFSQDGKRIDYIDDQNLYNVNLEVLMSLEDVDDKLKKKNNIEYEEDNKFKSRSIGTTITKPAGTSRSTLGSLRFGAGGNDFSQSPEIERLRKVLRGGRGRYGMQPKSVMDTQAGRDLHNRVMKKMGEAEKKKKKTADRVEELLRKNRSKEDKIREKIHKRLKKRGIKSSGLGSDMENLGDDIGKIVEKLLKNNFKL